MGQLILVSTQKEIQAFVETAGKKGAFNTHELISISKDISLFVSGIGAPATIFNLTRLLDQNLFDRVIQVGIAGTFKREMKLGSLHEVREDTFADLGIDDRGNYKSIFDSGLEDSDIAPFTNGIMVNPIQNVTGLPMASSITVNTVSGGELLIDQRKSAYDPDLESMEGAASFYVCMNMNIPVLQVRSISNYIEPRNRNAWEIDHAVENLNKWLLDFVNIG